MEDRPQLPTAKIGMRVLHPIFGEGTVIGVPREGEGIIVQFDSMVTPRTFGPGAKLGRIDK